MSSNFYTSSHQAHHLHPRCDLTTSRALDSTYATPHQLYILRIYFSNLISKLGKRLLLRQIPIATATVLFQRFYLKNSYCETNPYLVLAACCFVAAKVEETPVHIKSVVTEGKVVFAEHNIKMFPSDTHKLGEMEFYLLEDLDFHLIVFHPYRALLAMTGREPSDGGKFPKSRVEEDRGITGRAHAGGRGRKAGEEDDVLGEGEGGRIRRLMGRGSGEGLMEVDEGVLQLSIFLLNDTYRTEVHLLYPPHIIALSALYMSFCLTSMNNPQPPSSNSTNSTPTTTPNTRSTRSTTSTQQTTLLQSIETNSLLSLPPPPMGAAEFIASFEVSMPVLLACVQDMVMLYPIWEGFEPSPRSGAGRDKVGMGGAAGVGGGGGGVGGGGGGKGGEKFGPEEAEALVRRMIEERAADLAHPENAGKGSAETASDPLAQIVGRKRKH